MPKTEAGFTLRIRPGRRHELCERRYQAHRHSSRTILHRHRRDAAPELRVRAHPHTCKRAPHVNSHRLSKPRKASRLLHGAYRPVSRRRANRTACSRHPTSDFNVTNSNPAALQTRTIEPSTVRVTVCALNQVTAFSTVRVVSITCSFHPSVTVPSVTAVTVYKHRGQHVKPTGYGIHHSAPITVSRSTIPATTDPGVSLTLSTVIGTSVLLPNAHPTTRRYASVTATGS